MEATKPVAASTAPASPEADKSVRAPVGTNQLGIIFSKAARSVVMTREGPAKAQAGQTLNALGSAIAKHHAAFDDILVGEEAQKRLQGRHAAVQVINGKVTLMLDMDAYVAQHAGISDPKAAATATAREELWHALSLRLEAEGNQLFSMAQKLKQWRALPAELKQQVWQSYHALAISTGKLPREMPATFTETEDYSMAEEYLRMLAQNETFQDSITETVDPDSSLLTWIRDVLAALGDKLKQWLKQASPEVRADLQMMVTALQQAEARFAKVSTGKAATVSNPHTPTAEQVLAALSEQQPNAFGDAALNGLFDTLPQAVKTDLVTVAKAKAKAGTKFTKAALARRYLAEIATDETQQTALLVAAMGGPRPATMGMGSLNAMLSRVLAWLGDPVAAQTALSKMDARKVLRLRYRMEEAQAFMAAGVQVSRMTDAQVDNQIVEVNKKVAPVVPDEDEQAWQQAIREVMPTINAQRLQAQITERTTAMRWAALQQRAARMAEATDALARSDLGNALMKVELAMRERVGRRVALAKALARKRMVDASQKEMAEAVEAGRITPAQALYTARLLDIAGGIADRYARRRVQGIGTHLLATLNAVGIGSEGGNFYTADPNGDAYVERRRVILKQAVLDKLAEVLPASRALIAMDEAQARAFYGLPAGPAQPQTRADVDAQLDAERATLAGAEPAPEETAPNAAPVARRENNPEPWPTREEFFANNPPDASAPPTVPRDIPRATKAAAATPAPATEDTALEDELGSAADRFLSRKPKRPALDKLLAKIPNASTGDTTRNNLLQTLLRSPLLMPTKAQRKGKGEWDWMETSPLFTESALFGWRMRLFRTSSSAGRKGDLEERLNALENEGHMPDASGTLTGTDLSDALMAAIGQYEALLRGDPLTAKAVEDERMTELEAQTVRFEKDTETGPLGVDVASLEPGQVLTLKDDAGEPHRLVVESLNITPLQDSEFEEGNPLHFWQNGKAVELTSVALQDGTTYGLQRVAGSATIFVDGIDNGRAARGAAPTNIVPTTLAEDSIPLAAAVRRATAKLAPTQREALKTYRDLTKRVQSGDRLQPAQAVALEDAERTLGQQFFFDIADGFATRSLESWQQPQRLEQGALFAANRRVEQGFYSKLAATLDAKMPNRADADMIKGMVSNPQNGIKPEELKWSGLLTWLDGQVQPVAKATVLDYLRNEGAVRLKEVALGQYDKAVLDRQSAIHERYRAITDELADSRALEESGAITKDELRKRAGQLLDERAVLDRELNQIARQLSKNNTQYAAYQLPAGENYREVVLAMGGKPDAERYAKMESIRKELENPALTEDQKHALRVQYRDLSDVSTGYAGYTSSHFPNVPNYVAHMRVNERADTEGKPGLFLEEVQSDRHQAGREKGYAEPRIAVAAKIVAKTRDYTLYDVFDKDGNRLASDREADSIEEAIASVEPFQSEGIPDAPFRKDWALAMVKRALRDAVATGKGFIGWTVGSVQAARFNLSQEIKHVAWEPAPNGVYVSLPIRDTDQQYEFIADTAGVIQRVGLSGRGKEFIGNNLAEVIGKEVTAKVLATPKGKLEGDDLRVGGKGMEGFYDNILPKEVQKYVKQWVAKVERRENGLGIHLDPENNNLPYKANATDSPDNMPYWRVDITPAMRESVAQGQALFATERSFTGGLSAQLAQASNVMGSDTREALPMDEAIVQIESFHGDPEDTDYWPKDMAEQWAADPLRRAVEEEGDFLQALPHLPDELRNSSIIQQYAAASERYNALDKWVSVELERINALPKADFWALVGPSAQATYNEISSNDLTAFKRAVFINELKDRLAKETALSESERYDFEAANELSDEAGEWLESEEMEAVLQGRKNALIDKVKIRVNRAIAQIEATGRYTWDANTGTFDEQDAPQVLYAAQRALFDDQDSLFMGGRDQLGFTDVQRPQAPKTRTPAEMTDDELAATMAEFRRQIAPLEAEQRELREKTKRAKQKFQSTPSEQRSNQLARQIDDLYRTTGAQPAQMEINKRDHAKNKARAAAAAEAKNTALARLLDSDELPHYPLADAALAYFEWWRGVPLTKAPGKWQQALMTAVDGILPENGFMYNRQLDAEVMKVMGNQFRPEDMNLRTQEVDGGQFGVEVISAKRAVESQRAKAAQQAAAASLNTARIYQNILLGGVKMKSVRLNPTPRPDGRMSFEAEDRKGNKYSGWVLPTEVAQWQAQMPAPVAEPTDPNQGTMLFASPRAMEGRDLFNTGLQLGLFNDDTNLFMGGREQLGFDSVMPVPAPAVVVPDEPKAQDLHAMGQQGERLPTDPAVPEVTAPSPTAAVVPEPALDEPPVQGQVTDFGEVIPFARKHTARPLGPKPKIENTLEDTDKDLPAWRRKYIAAQEMRLVRTGMGYGPQYYTSTPTGKWIVARKDGSNVRSPVFDTEQAALEAIPLLEVARNHAVGQARKPAPDGSKTYAIYRKIGERKRPVVKGGFASYEEGMAYMVTHPAEIIEHKFAFPTRPWLDRLERTGGTARVGDVTPQMFQDTFAFRGGQFGNWNMGGDGQAALNGAYDALLDFADILGVQPKALSLNGELAIAFGARGHGGEGAGAAHYEPGFKVINLTKIRGAGSLAHEWFHAFDHYLGRQDGKGARRVARAVEQGRDADYVRDEYVSHGFGYQSGVREALREAFKAVIDRMTSRKEARAVQVGEKQADMSVSNVKRHLDQLRQQFTTYHAYSRKKVPATAEQLAEWDRISEQIMALDVGEALHIPGLNRMSIGRLSFPRIEELNAIYKTVLGRSFATNQDGSLGKSLYWAIKHAGDVRARLAAASEGATEIKTVATDYFTEAKFIDEMRAEDYWSTPHEMGARSFESFIADKLAQHERRNDYLVHGADNRLYALIGLKPYPEGQERAELHQVWQAMFDIIQQESTDTGNVRLFAANRRAEGPTRQVPASQFTTIPEDEARARADAAKGGPDWAANVDLSEPVGAWIDRQDGKLKIFDGHHRWLAGMMTDRPLKVRQNVFDEVAGLGLAEKYLAAAPRGSTKNPGLVAQAGEVSQFQLETQRVTMLQRGRASNQIEGAEKGSLAEPVVAATENIDSPDEFPQLDSSTAAKISDWWSSTNSPAARNRTNEISSLQRQTDSLSAAIAADKVALSRAIPNARTGYYLQWNEPINAVIVANEAGDRTKMNAAEFVATYQKLSELPEGFKMARHERGFRVENDAGERASGTSPQPRTALLNFWARKARVLPNRPPQNDDYAELGLLRWLADPNQQGYVATGLAVENLSGIDFTDGPDVRSGYMADMIKDLQKAAGDKVEIVGFQIGSATQNKIVPVLASMDNGGGTTVGDTGRAGQWLIEQRIKRNESALDAAKVQQEALQAEQAAEEQRRAKLQQEALPALRSYLEKLHRNGGTHSDLPQEQQGFLNDTPELQETRNKFDKNNQLNRLAAEPLFSWGQIPTADKAAEIYATRKADRASLIDQGASSKVYPESVLKTQFQQYLNRGLELLSFGTPNNINGWGEHLEKRLKLINLGADIDLYPSAVVQERMEKQSARLAREFLQQEARQQQEAMDALNRRWLPKWFPPNSAAQPSAPAEWWKDLLDQREEAERKPAQTFIARLWQALAAHDEAFQYGRSFSPRADAIAKAVSLPGKLVTATSTGDTVRFMGPSGHLTINDTDTDRPYIRSIAAASQGKKSGGGTQLYQAALDWIHNNAARIKDDSSLTTINAIRRTSNFASSALRWGTTKHLKPHADQKVPWGKNESINTAALLMREMDHAFKAVDQAKEWRYDFANDEFRDAADQPLDMSRIESAVSAGNPSQSGIGVSTLERAVITRSALEAFQRGEAQSVISQIKGRGTPPERLTGILYAAPRTLDTAAHEAATSPLNARPEPTDAQKKAGNYALGHIKIGPLDVSIENPAGSVRRGTDAQGKAWKTPMHLHYGYVKGSKSADGDHIDTFIAPGTPTDYDGPVWVVNQKDKGGAFDEHKAVFGPGITGPREALAAYLANYTDGWDGAQSLGRFKSVADFHAWATEATQRRAPARGHLPSALPVNPALAAAARKYVPEMKAMLAAAPRVAETGDLFKLDNGQMQAYFDLPDVRIPTSKQPAARAAISAAAAVTGSSYERRSVVSAARGEPGRQQEVDAAREPALRAWRGLIDRDPAAIRSALDEGKGRISSLLEQFVNRQIPTFDIRGAVLDSPADFAAFNLAVRTPYFESLKIAVVDGANQVVHSQIVHIGALNESIAHPGSIAQVLAHAQLANPDVELAGWIIAHNHPSGDPNPSDADQRVTRRFADMGEILRLPLIDHVITNGERYFSFREGGFLRGEESFNTDKAPQSTGLPALPIPPRPARGIMADWEVLPSGSDQRPVLNNPSVTAPYLTALRTADPDHYHLLYLNTKLALIAVERVDQSTGMNAREFASRAILGAGREGAMAVALSMPGADGPTDSQRRLVRTVNEALQSSMIQFADAMVATTNAHFSFREAGLLREESPALAAAPRQVTPEQDATYMAAVEAGDMETAWSDIPERLEFASKQLHTKWGSRYYDLKYKGQWYQVRLSDHSQKTDNIDVKTAAYHHRQSMARGTMQDTGMARPHEINIVLHEPVKSERVARELILKVLREQGQLAVDRVDNEYWGTEVEISAKELSERIQQRDQAQWFVDNVRDLFLSWANDRVAALELEILKPIAQRMGTWRTGDAVSEDLKEARARAMAAQSFANGDTETIPQDQPTDSRRKQYPGKTKNDFIDWLQRRSTERGSGISSSFYSKAYDSILAWQKKAQSTPLTGRAGESRLDMLGRGPSKTEQGTSPQFPPAVNDNLSSSAPALGAAPRQVTPEQDATYMAAVEAGDMEAAQRMVGEAAKAAGFDRKLFHGTNATETVEGESTSGSDEAIVNLKALAERVGLREWYGATSVYQRLADNGQMGVTQEDASNAKKWQAEATGTYQPSREKLSFDVFSPPSGELELGVHLGNESAAAMFGEVFPFFAKLGKPFRLPDLGTWNYQSVMRELRKRGVKISEAEYDAVFNANDNNEALRALLQSKGIESIVYRNEAEGEGDSFIVFDPNQIKSADPITRDPSGAVIPLSQRFNEASDSILYAAPRTTPEANPLARLGFNNLDRALTDKVAALTAKPRASAAEAVAAWASTEKVKPFADMARWAQGQLFPDSLLPREITAAMREMQIRSALGGQKAMDLQRALSGNPKFSDLAYPPEFTENPIWRERLFDAMEGRADMAELPPAIQALGKRLRAMLVQHGREAVKAGRMSLETFEGLQENFMPRFTRDEAEAASGDFVKKFKLGVKDILQQRSTAWHIVDTTQKDPRTGEYVTVSHDDRGRKWRFRDEAQRNAFYQDYTKREAVRMLKDQGRQVTDLLAALDTQQKKEVRAEIARMTADQVDRPAELSPALAGIVKRALAIQRQRYERRDPFDPPALIRDPVYAIARYTAQASHDNATAEFFNFVDKNPAWVRDTAATGYVFIPDNPRFGRLAGKHVQADIANQITEMVEAPDTALKIYDTLMGWWKTGKTVLNPGTHVRNVLGNLFFSQLAGNSPWNPGNMGYYKEAIAALRAGGPALIEAYEQGVLGADFVTAELRQTLRQLLPEPASVMSDKPELLLGIGKAAGKLMPQWMRTPTRSAYNQIAAAYQVEDELFKLAAYLKAKGMGMDNKAAAEHVRKWFPYFDKGTSTTLKLVGRTAMPFMGFYRESARIFSHALRERPLALATGLSIPSLITYISALMLGLNDQDKEEVMTDMRGKGGKLLGPTPLGKVPLFAMLLPIRTADGDLQQIDLSAIHPFTDFLGTRVESRGGDWWEDTIRSMVTAGPLASLAYAQMTGRDAFGDRTFVEADMTGGEKLAARLDNAGATLLPPLTPIVGTGYKTIAGAGQRSTNKTLETRNLPQAITRAIGGVDIRNANPDLYRLAEDFRKEHGMDIDPARDFGTTAISRARAQVFAEIAQDAPDKEKLRRALAFLRVQGVPIDTQQDINRLLFYRDPLKVIGGDKAKGISAKDAQQMFQGSLSPEGRRVLIEAVREFSRIQQRAPAAIASARSGGN